MRWFLFTVLLLSMASSNQSDKRKNLILIVGDGMGSQQIAVYQQLLKSKGQKSAFNRISKQGQLLLTATQGYRGQIIDSAGSATQLATGQPSLPGLIGMNYHAERVPTILELAKQRGFATGLVSDTRLTHATPAAFAAHNISRYNENEIAEEMISGSVDILLSGGLNNFIPESNSGLFLKSIPPSLKFRSRRKDNKNLLLAAKKAGYDLVFDANMLENSKSDKILGLFAGNVMSNRLNPTPEEPSLLAMVKSSLGILAKKEDGFVLVVESGQIDWAGHSNDIGLMLAQLDHLNQVLDYTLNWAELDGSTMVVLTADHETGGLVQSYSKRNVAEPSIIAGKPYKPSFNFGHGQNLAMFEDQKKGCLELLSTFYRLEDSQKTPKQFMNLVNDAFPVAITPEQAKIVLDSANENSFLNLRQLEKEDAYFANYYNYKGYKQCSILARIMLKDTNIIWSTGGHSSAPVLSYTYGASSGLKFDSNAITMPELGMALQGFLGLN